ncbi:hypothetical protein [Nocardioides soli]|uniref:Uncharacterized protein n=1 Tax=Nocardioides soli TaxID=1036020 RepID=A0A7W4VT25_9ACTN|nr:hypothetical protein [Nocardioides soli]MBB3041246.1 hypothetical protein [Nocardioides soli]
MDRTPDEIEDSLSIPEEVVQPAVAKMQAQDAERGDWPSPRETRMPEQPWPAPDDPMLRFLLHKAKASIDAGMDVGIAMVQLATHAWFEGGIENYDRGVRDGRRPRSV